MARLLIIDYKVGNHRSVANALARLGCAFAVSSRPEDLAAADALILPGVGAFGEAMANLRALGLVDVLREEALARGKPLLGICLGMQILAEESCEMGAHRGLGLVRGRVRRIEPRGDLRVPQVGWNTLAVTRRAPLFDFVDDGTHVYFDHSYHLDPGEDCVAATCSYGGDLVAAVQKDNVFGVQFHPEKSQVAGLKVLRRFLRHVGQG